MVLNSIAEAAAQQGVPVCGAVAEYGIGQYEVVVINRGVRDGLQPGNVLAVYSASDPVYDISKHGFVHAPSLIAKKVDLPEERTGTFMVFKTFDRMSFGLIMEATDVIHVADNVQSP